MNVTLVDHTHDPELKIARFASICYDSDPSPEACAKRLKNLIKMKHLATLRFASATFLIDGISRICSHQLVRAKHLDFLQESQRYVEQDTDLEFVVPGSVSESPHEDLGDAWADLLDHSLAVYRMALKKGVKKEDARFALLHSAPTRLYVTGNFQAWDDFLKNRLTTHAQWEIREVASLIAWELARIAPNIFGHYLEN